MHKLSFWHKLAFLANLCWLATWGLKYYSFLPEGDIRSTVLVIGLVLAPVTNMAVNLFTALLFLRGKLAVHLSRWLASLNFLFLTAELYLFFK